VLARHVGTSGAHVVPGQRPHEVSAGPLEYGASGQVNTASRLGFRMSDERHDAALRPAARDDVYMVREDRHLVEVYVAARGCFKDAGPHDIGVVAPHGALPKARVPGDVHVQSESSMCHDPSERTKGGRVSADPGAVPRGPRYSRCGAERYRTSARGVGKMRAWRRRRLLTPGRRPGVSRVDG